MGISEAAICRWIASGYLIACLPRVYAVGHVATSQEARLFEAILFAGPDAVLSHGTAAWWRGLLSWPVRSTHISTPRQIKTSPPGLTIHSRRQLDVETVNGLPVTTVTKTLLDLAASESLKLVRHALAQLDYTGGFAPAELYAACGHGRRGSAGLASALREHLPELARTRSELEVQFVLLCERFQIPMPLMNRTIHGVEADAWWPDFNLVVELDGNANHHTPAQRNKDLRKELTLRDHGITVLRYDYHLATRTPSKIRDDLRSQMRER
jgi:very-short-patch-repair endonuclease